MSAIQQVYLPKEEYSIYIKGIKPDEDNPYSGEITLNGNPTRLERKERYHVDGVNLVTDNYTIPINFIIKFLEENECFEEHEGKLYVAFKEVKFKPNISNG